MKRGIPFFLTVLLCAPGLKPETFGDTLSAGTLGTIQQSITLKPQEISPEQQKIQKLTDTPPKPVDGITIRVMDLNIGKKSSVSVEYAPEIKKDDLIDNKTQTNINYNLKF